MGREGIIHKITLIDTQLYRVKSMRELGVYKKEPKGFRSRLYEIYDELSLEGLETLLRLKEI